MSDLPCLGNMHRLYVKAPFQQGHPVVLSEAQTHRVRHVLRLECGQRISIFNGEQGEWQGDLDFSLKRQARVHVQSQTRTPTGEDPVRVALLFALLKPHRLSMMLEKATEMGVHSLVPCLTQHTSIRSINEARVLSTLVEAAEQSHRLTVPRVSCLRALEEHLHDWPSQHVLFLCDPHDEGALALGTALDHSSFMSQEKRSTANTEMVGIAVGPEGGWSAHERAFLRTLPFVRPVCLGPTILRAETAALVGVALIRGWLLQHQGKKERSF